MDRGNRRPLLGVVMFAWFALNVDFGNDERVGISEATQAEFRRQHDAGSGAGQTAQPAKQFHTVEPITRLLFNGFCLMPRQRTPAGDKKSPIAAKTLTFAL